MANKNFLDIAGLTHFWNKIAEMIPKGDLVVHTEASNVEDLNAINATTLGGHAANYFAKATDITTLQSTVKTHASEILTMKNSLSSLQQTANDNSTTLSLLSSTVDDHSTSISTLKKSVSGYDTSIRNLQNTISGYSSKFSQLDTNDEAFAQAIGQLSNGKLDKSGGEMTGQLVAYNNTEYATAQLRNVIISTADPGATDGANGMIWIKYTA